MSKEEIEILYQEEDNTFLGISYEPNINAWIMHVDIDKWSVENYKRYLKIFIKTIFMLKERGIKEVFGLCDTEKEIKFNELFGFTNTGLEATGHDGTKSTITRLEI